MSKKNNVNPNFYKVGGREPSEGHGEAIPHEQEKQKFQEATKQQSQKASEKQDKEEGQEKKSGR